MAFRFVAESTGHQVSSRLLSMKSANALLELPASGNVISAGTYVSAIMISDLRETDISECTLTSMLGSTSLGTKAKEVITNGSSSAEVRVAVLTVSDTVASGSGPDRR